MSTEDLIQKISRWLPDVKRLHGHILKLSTKLSQCERARMQARIYWIRSGWTQTNLWTQHTRNFDRDCVLGNTKRRGKARLIQRALLASQLFSAMPPPGAVKALVSTTMSVGSSSTGTPLKLRDYDISRAHFQATAQDRNMVPTELAD